MPKPRTFDTRIASYEYFVVPAFATAQVLPTHPVLGRSRGFLQTHVGVSQSQGSLVGGPYKKVCSILGLILGSPIYANYQIEAKKEVGA